MNLLQVISDILFAIVGISLIVNKFWKPKRRQKSWHLKIYTVEGLETHKVTVLDDEYNALKTWLRGEGDSLFELATDDAYLGLKRAHVVSVKGVKK